MFLPILLFTLVHVLWPMSTLAGVSTVASVPATMIHGWSTAVRTLVETACY